jgi:hypothetical protein
VTALRVVGTALATLRRRGRGYGNGIPCPFLRLYHFVPDELCIKGVWFPLH